MGLIQSKTILHGLTVILLVLTLLCGMSFQTVAAESPSFSVVTAVSNEEFLSRLPPTKVKVGEGLEAVSGLIGVLNGQKLTVSHGAETEEVPIRIAWDYSRFHTDKAGFCEIVGEILPPDGIAMSGQVLSRIVVPIEVEAVSDDPQEIIAIANHSFIVNPIVIYRNDTDGWSQKLERLSIWFEVLGGYSDNGDEARLELEDLDTDDIRLDTVGSYTLTAKVRVADDDAEQFYISDTLRTLLIPVQVIDRNEFYLSPISPKSTVQTATYTLFSDKVTVYCAESPTELSQDDVLCDAQIADDRLAVAQNGVLTIFSNQLQSKHYCYFYLEHNGKRSNIVSLYTDSDEAPSNSIEGHRDGGDTKGNPIPDYAQDAPTVNEPSDTPSPNSAEQPTERSHTENSGESPTLPFSQSNASESAVSRAETSVTATENVTRQSDTLSGSRIHTVTNDVPYLTFSKNGITVKIPADTVQQWQIGSTDSLTVEITQPESRFFDIQVSVNGQAVGLVNGMKIGLPCEQPDVQIIDKNGHAYDVTYDNVSQTVQFVTDVTGLYEMKFSEPDGEKSDGETVAAVPTANPRPNNPLSPTPAAPKNTNAVTPQKQTAFWITAGVLLVLSGSFFAFKKKFPLKRADKWK